MRNEDEMKNRLKAPGGAPGDVMVMALRAGDASPGRYLFFWEGELGWRHHGFTPEEMARGREDAAYMSVIPGSELGEKPPQPEPPDIVRGEALVRSLAVELDLGEAATGGAMVERIRELAQSNETLDELMHRQGIATEAYDGHEAAHAELRRRWGQDCIGGLDCIEAWRKALRMPGASLPDLQDRVESLLHKEQIADANENSLTDARKLFSGGRCER